MRGAALASTGAAAGLALGGAGQNAEATRFHGDGNILGQGDTARQWYRFKFIGQAVMDTQLLFFMGLAPTGLTDIGEVLDTATRISPGDEVSWFEQWLGTAKRVSGYGEVAMAQGHTLSAASHFYRAGAYYRAGLIRYSNHRDPRLVEATRAAMDMHDRALRMFGYDSRAVEIPYQGSSLVGRIHYSSKADRAAVLVLHQGLHAWPEDTMWVIDGALERGYHVLSFHGPGQGATLRLHGHPFRPDWEVPVGCVLDFAEKDARLDVNRSILMGLSFGGYLAPRAASYEPRIRTLVANPGVVSWGGAMLRHFEEIPGLLALHRKSPEAFDRAIDAVSKFTPDARWYFDDVTWKHGVSSAHAVVDELRKFDNTDGVRRIRCRTLIMEGSAEDATPGESRRLYESLVCPKEMMVFGPESAAQVHCQGAGQVLARARLFDWLDSQVLR